MKVEVNNRDKPTIAGVQILTDFHKDPLKFEELCSVVY
jgi:hypothetical protein